MLRKQLSGSLSSYATASNRRQRSIVWRNIVMFINVRYISLLLLLFGWANTTLAQEDPFEQRAKDIEFYLEQEPAVAPCYTKQLRYYNSFPAWVTGARDRDTEYETNGKVTPEYYRTLRHSSVHKQRYPKGGKTYIKPAFVKRLDPEHPEKEPEERFIGFVEYRVAQVIETYDPKKHDRLTLVTYPDVVPGITTVRPLYFYKRVHTRPRKWKTKKFVVYENCYAPKIKLADASSSYINALRTEFGATHYNKFFSGHPPLPIFPVNNYGRIDLYGPEDIPTLLGYRGHVYSKLKADMNLDGYDKLIDGMVIVRNVGLSVIPGVGSGMSVYNCATQGDVACWDAAVDIAADAAFFLKIGKVANMVSKIASRAKDTEKAAKVVAGLESVGNTTLRFMAGTDVALGIYYTANGKPLEGVMRIVSSAQDVAYIKYTGGKNIAGDLEVKATKCDDEPLEFDYNKFDADPPSVHRQERGVHRDLDPPAHVRTRAQLEAAVAHHNKEAHLDVNDPIEFDEVKVQTVRRHDSRDLDEIIEEGGCYPWDEHPSGTIRDQIDSPTSDWLSTTYADNIEHLVKHPAFFSKNKRLNYDVGSPERESLLRKIMEVNEGNAMLGDDFIDNPSKYGLIFREDGLIRMEKDLFIYWPDDVPLPDPVHYRAFEYISESPAARVKYTKYGEELEAVTTAMRIDEMTGARELDVYLDFYVEGTQLRLKPREEARVVTGETIDIYERWLGVPE